MWFKILGLAAGLLYIFMPPLIVNQYFTESIVLTGLHTCFSHLLVITCIFRLMRRRQDSRDGILLLLAFVFALIADAIYLSTIADRWQNNASALVHIRETCFLLFMVLLTLHITPRILRVTRDFISWLIMAVSLLFFGFININYALGPYFTSQPVPTPYLLTTSTIYMVAQVVLLASIVPIIIRTSDARTHYWLQALFFMGLGDFGIRAFLKQPGGDMFLIGYEHAWEIAMATCGVMAASSRRVPLLSFNDIVPYRSLRVLLTLGICFGMAAFFVLLRFVRLVSLDDTFNLASVLIAASGAWLLANAGSLHFTQYFFGNVLRFLKNDVAGTMAKSRRFPIIPMTKHLFEIEGLVKTYNDLSDQAQELCDQAAEASRLTAVAGTTQMLVHDIRKPFSILRMGLTMLGAAKDPASVKLVLSRLVPEVDRVMSSVDGLIVDIMEIGSTATQLIQEPISPETLIKASLEEIFRVYPEADISLTYEQNHNHMVYVNASKVGRVFVNIMDNAVHAMGRKGEMWFRTREDAHFVEFCIGNSGSFISEEKLPKLFDAFFTSGKKSGTGLGLAIAQKVVTAHGGYIWCESVRTLQYPLGKVEFFFTLPLAKDQPTNSEIYLPFHSTEIHSILLTAAEAEAISSPSGIDNNEIALEANIVRLSGKIGRPLQILLVDDEAIYRNTMVALLSRTSALTAAVATSCASSVDEALELAHERKFDLIITDVDMGQGSLDGFELVENIRRLSGADQPMICVHSNRMCPSDHRTALDRGASAFIPKPIARAQLLKQVLQSGASLLESRQNPGVAADYAPPSAGQPEVLIVEDNPFILEAWTAALNEEGAMVHAFTSLEQVVERLGEDPKLVDRLVCAVTDMHLDGSAGDGLDVSRLLKERRPTLPVMLSTDGIFHPDERFNIIDRVIGKDPLAMDLLLSSRQGSASSALGSNSNLS